MTQEQEQTLNYQWIKGEQAGSIEEIEKEEGGFIYFKSGRRINSDLINEYLMETTEGAIPLKDDIEMKSEPVLDPTAGLKEAGRIDPTAGLKVAGEVPTISQPQPSITVPDSPVVALLKKMGDSSKDTVEISLKVSVKIPKKGTFAILEESFGEEVLQNVEGMALSQIDESKVREELQATLKDKVLKHYK